MYPLIRRLSGVVSDAGSTETLKGIPVAQDRCGYGNYIARSLQTSFSTTAGIQGQRESIPSVVVITPASGQVSPRSACTHCYLLGSQLSWLLSPFLLIESNSSWDTDYQQLSRMVSEGNVLGLCCRSSHSFIPLRCCISSFLSLIQL